MDKKQEIKELIWGKAVANKNEEYISLKIRDVDSLAEDIVKLFAIPVVSGSLWPDDLLNPTALLKARLNTLEVKQQSGDKLNLIDEFKKAIKLIESVKQ